MPIRIVCRELDGYDMSAHLYTLNEQAHAVALYLGCGNQSALSWNLQSLYLGGFQQTEHHVVPFLECRSMVYHCFERVAHRGCSRTCERMEAQVACFRAILLDEVSVAHRLPQ